MMLRVLLGAYRQVHQLSLRDLERRIGVSYVTLHRFERGHSIRHLELVKIWQWLLAKEKP